MEATIDQQKIDLHHWIMAHRETYKLLTIKIVSEDSLLKEANNYRIAIDQSHLDKLIEQKKKMIELYLNQTIEPDTAMSFIIDINNHIKNILGI